MTGRWWSFLSLGTALAVIPESHLAAGDVPHDSSSSTSAPSSLSIQSIPESALVMIDAKLEGSTPVTIDSIKPGIHIVILQHPDLESWLTEPISDTIQVDRGERKVLRYNLRARHLITTTPFGAEVVLGDSVIGSTPLVTGPKMEGQSLTLRRSGYEAAIIHLSAGQSGIVDVPLRKVWQDDGNGEPYLRDADSQGSGSAGVYLSGAATVVSGFAAAYFKIKADNRYQQFLDTNDGRLLSQTHRLDTAAGLAIAATQIGLGLFTYFIFSR